MSEQPDSAKTDFRPSDYRDAAPPEQSAVGVIGWVFLAIGLAILATGGWAYKFRPQWIAQIYDLATNSPVPAQDDKVFAALYQKYAMTPLGAGVAGVYSVNPLLASLAKEPCDKRVVYQASVAVENAGARRGAAEMLKGFADACPEGNNERYRASELYYALGDYDMAVKLSSAVVDHQPDAQNAYYVRARAEQGLERYAAAIEDYTTLIQLIPDIKSIVSEVFTRLSESYDKLNRPCEAIGPIQTYIALDNEKRSTPALLKRVAALTAKGSCTQAYAKGVTRIPRRSNGVTIAKVQINGVEGTFVVDTGATFVTLTPSFANKTKVKMFKTDAVEILTANGTTAAKLATVDSVKLDELSASGVPTVIVSKSFGNGIDGLLGMSFLSRFTIAIRERDIQLTAKALGE